MRRFLSRFDHARRRPVRAVLSYVLLLALTILPMWLFWDWLVSPQLKGDDFAYVAQSGADSEPLRALFQPHNAHVVPLFRIWTAAIRSAAGSLAALPLWLSLANFAALMGTLLLAGHLVAVETRRTTYGLMAVALIGLSTVLRQSIVWYAAGQSLVAACLAALALVLAQAYRMRGRAGWLAASCGAVCAAALVWGGGLCAGPAVTAYLAHSPDRRKRVLSYLPLLCSCVLALFFFIVASGSIQRVAAVESALPFPVALARPLVHTCQAVVEALMFGNLGLDARTSGGQACVMVATILVVWITRVARRGRPSPYPLEWAGLVLVCVPYLMAFTLRRGYAYENLRDMGWYNTLPQLGAVLFGMGWLGMREAALPGRPAHATLGGIVNVAALVTIMLCLHVPRAHQMMIESEPPMTESERERFLIPELQRLRSIYVYSERADRQRRALVRLDQLDEQARRLGLSRASLRSAFGPVRVPGWPAALVELDAFDLLKVRPDGGPQLSPGQVRALAPLVAYEQPARPPWISPSEPWPPREWTFPGTPLP